MSSTYNMVKSAISALLIPSETANANKWLTDFEREFIAWEIAEKLLNEPSNTTFRFFGAKILYSKIQRQFFQLSNNQLIESLIKSIVDHLIKLSEEKPLDTRVCRYLSLALSALSLQINQEGVVSQILSWLNAIINSAPKVILNLLVVLPEEAYNDKIDVDGETRDKFSSQLSLSGQNIVNFLSFLWPHGDLEVKLQIIRCLENWIRFTSIPSGFIMSQPIFQQALLALNESELYLEYVVDLIVACILRYGMESEELVSSILSFVVSLNSKWDEKLSALSKFLDEDDIHICQSIARLFCEAAEAYLDILISDPTFNKYQQIEIFKMLLSACKFQYDNAVSRIPLKFFYELCSYLRTLKINSNSNYEFIVSKVSPMYISLLECAINQMALPEDVLFGKSKISSDSDDRRYEWRDTVSDCCEILGESLCIQFCHNYFLTFLDNIKTGQTSQWSYIESTLFALQLTAHNIPQECDSHITSLLNVILTFPQEIFELRITVLSLLGKLSRWISNNLICFQPTIMYLLSTMSDSRINAVSSKSLIDLCDFCGSKVQLPFDLLNRTIQESRNYGNLSLTSDLNLLHAVTISISYLPLNTHNSAFIQVIEPIVNSLQNYLRDTSKTSDNSSSKSILSGHIERLTIVLRYVRVSGDIVVNVFIKIFPIVQSIYEINSSDYICEKICRLYKHSIRSCKEYFIPHLNSMVEHLTTYFQKYQCSSFIYVGSICLSDYYKINDGAYVDTLYKMIWSFSNIFFSKFYGQEQFMQYPDVVEEYFYLLSKALRYCPEPFVMSKNESLMVVKAGIEALQLQHKEAQKGVYQFLENLMNLPHTTKSNSILYDKSKLLISEVGSHVVKGAFLQLSGQWPVYSIDEKDGCVGDVLWVSKISYPDLFQLWVKDAMQSLSVMALEESVKLNLFDSVTTLSDKKSFITLIDDYEWKCSKRKPSALT